MDTTSTIAGKYYLIACFIESVLYGYCISLYVTATTILFRRRKERPMNTALIAVSFAMFCISTVNIGNEIHRSITAFLDRERSPDIYLQTINDPSYILLATINGVQTFFGDGFLVRAFFTPSMVP